MKKTEATPSVDWLMRPALTELLNSVSGSRKVLRHLAAVEHALKHKDKDGEFLFDEPSERLKVILQQLDGLLGTTPPPGLTALRTRVYVALKTKEKSEELLARSQPVSSFFVDHKLQVTEVNAVDFDKLSADWMGPAT
jgi:hypothetical protein